MAQDWTRIEGMIIGHELDPSAVAGELKKRAILTQIEWFPSSPQPVSYTHLRAHET